MAWKKKSNAGREEREMLIEAQYGHHYRTAQSSLPHGRYNNDDLLDAFAALWTAERLSAKSERVLCSDLPVDSCGLRMEIVV
jgi:predicted RNase H-like nuclease